MKHINQKIIQPSKMIVTRSCVFVACLSLCFSFRATRAELTIALDQQDRPRNNMILHSIKPSDPYSTSSIQSLSSLLKTKVSSSRERTVLEIVKDQWKRLCRANIFRSSSIPSSLTILFILFGWTLLVSAKALLIVSPIFFKNLVNLSQDFDRSLDYRNILQWNFFGILIGFGCSKIASGLLIYLADLILLPLIIDTATQLPMEAYFTELSLPKTGRRTIASQPALLNESVQSANRLRSESRALDRGLRANNLFLYRALFNIFPALLEISLTIAMMANKAGILVGSIAGAVTGLYLSLTFSIMHLRVPLLQRQLTAESAANRFVEDAIACGEVVRAYGGVDYEMVKYKRALVKVGRASDAVRKSFSQLKLLQSSILGLGSLLVTSCTLIPYLSPLGGFRHTISLSSHGNLASNLILIQSLFAQLFVPLDHIGQHFRDCASAMEDLRELYAVRSQGNITATRSNLLAVDLQSQLESFSCHNLFELKSQQALGDIIIPRSGYALGVVGPSGKLSPLSLA
jgi:hypothetical protein